jgi:mannose-6-phosphate isomerase-like protein (cupin superfamily)
MKLRFAAILLFLSGALKAQQFSGIDTIGTKSTTQNIYVKQLGGDSLSSCFVILIKQQVKLHKHAYHSETVTVLEGEGNMQLGDKNFVVKKGDVVFIPRNTPHAVISTGSVALKVISSQSPRFDGTDRILLEYYYFIAKKKPLKFEWLFLVYVFFKQIAF